jgi:hypothetical protein
MAKTAQACALVALLAVPALATSAARADGPAAAAEASPSEKSTGTVTVTDSSESSAAPGASAPPPASASAAPASSARGPAPGTEATGYGWSTPKKKGGHATAAHRPTPAGTEGTGAVVPGFEMLGDGSTRVFVQMPKTATFSTKSSRGRVTYVLKDVQVDKRNNYNPLVTVHFNTPVSSARLIPHGRDLWLVIALRAPVKPTAALQPAKDGGSVLQIDFPKGDYLPAPRANHGSPDDETTGGGGAPGH